MLLNYITLAISNSKVLKAFIVQDIILFEIIYIFMG